MAKARRFQLGDPIPGSYCPACGASITYNGNYFCIDCDWAMSDQEFCTPEEKHLYNVAYATLMRCLEQEPKASALWLKRNGEPW